MKSSLVLLMLASTLIVGCAGSNPVGPDTALVSREKSSTASSGSSSVRAFLPPINPSGISCPSDAPAIADSSLNLRMDIEFSEVAGAYAYEIEITNIYGDKTRVEVAAPANRAEWHGPVGFYSVRVRTLNCGGKGNWSAVIQHALHNGTAPPPEAKPPVEPPVEPQCMQGCVPPPPPPPQCMAGCFPFPEE